VVAFLGFGELATALASVLREGGAESLQAFSRRRLDPGRSAEAVRRMAALEIRSADTLVSAVHDADVVLSCVPGAAAAEVAEQAASALAPGALYVDLATASPEDKERGARAVLAGGGRYVDAAVLGAVAASGGAVPIAAAGVGAAAFYEFSRPLGLKVRAIDAPAGAAARIKLLRSVYMKGRDALVVEMLLGARRHGLEDAVAASIAGPGEEVPFPELAERILRSTALHARRRAAELGDARVLLEAADVEAAATAGAVRRLQLVAELEGERSVPGERPATPVELLEHLPR
jgi:3-hydroxyisobutyrate dehydrogenase-like beta-hydroxyacid dehydrogenase